MTDTTAVPVTEVPRIPSMVGRDRVSFFLNGRFRSYHLKSQQGQELLRLLKEEVQDHEKIGDLADIITWIAKQTNGRVTVEEGTDRLRLDGKLIDYGLSGRIATIVEQGVPFEHLARFIEKVSDNPDPTVAEDLYRFLEKGNLPLTPDGDFMAFKGVDDKGWSRHSGANGKVHYEVGKVVSMPRDQCDPNRQRTCSRGLHACSFGYLNFWYRNSGQLLAVKINPRNVTAIPADHDDQKLRCCEMEVMAIIPHEDAETHYPTIIDTRYPPKPEYPTFELSDDGRLAGGPPLDDQGRAQGWVEVGNVDGSEHAMVWAALPDVSDAGEPTGPADAVNDGPLKFTAIDGEGEATPRQIGKDEGYINGRKDKANDYPADETPDKIPGAFADPDDAQEFAQEYAAGYAEGYQLGYAEDADPAFEDDISWDLKRALHEGRVGGIGEADQDFSRGEYANDPTDVASWQSLVDWIEESEPDNTTPESHELVQAFDRSYRDAYHTRFNSKQDEAG